MEAVSVLEVCQQNHRQFGMGWPDKVRERMRTLPSKRASDEAQVVLTLASRRYAHLKQRGSATDRGRRRWLPTSHAVKRIPLSSDFHSEQDGRGNTYARSASQFSFTQGYQRHLERRSTNEGETIS